MKNTAYSYVIIKENNPTWEKERVLLKNKYDAKKKYVLIQKSVHTDGSESINSIDYSNDMAKFQLQANDYVSWYNYVLKLKKDIQCLHSITTQHLLNKQQPDLNSII